MKKLAGQVVVRGSIAYVPQIAWIQNVSLRENILFGLLFDAVRYEQVIDGCGLKPDLEILPAGDMTEIGEKGINLSGGQKQRVALARAAYSNADIYLLDDPLSAVDAHVAKHIFDKLLGPTGLLANKTRVLCTHAYNFLSQVDDIVVVQSGKITEHGSYETLLSNQEAFASLLKEHSQTEEADEESTPKPDKDKKEILPSQQDGKLIEKEGVEEGRVKTSVLVAYIKSVGTISFAVILILFGLSQGFAVSTNAVLSIWASEPIINGTQDVTKRNLYLSIYSGLGILQCLSNLAAYLAFYICSLSAARKLHNTMLARVIRAPMFFFDKTPLGRILNRFSTDVDTMDTNLISHYADAIISILKLLAVLFVVSYTTPLFLAFVIPMAAVYYFIQRFYVATIRQLQRLLAILKSPIYANFSETLNGSVTIRAFKAQNRFIHGIEKKIDTYQSCYFPHQVVRRWLSVRIETIGSSIIFIVAMAAVIWRNAISSSIIGLALTYVLQISDQLSWLVKIVSYSETDTVCIERILEYSELPKEAELEIPEEEPPPNWPQFGGIVFNEYGTRYREDLDLVLKRICCVINPGEKIGIVGRTGAGKSSLTLALFRLIEAAHGSIDIDNIDISNLGLHDVRKRLTVIPQDPVLFSTSLRMNLDPFDQYTDDQLWQALRHAHLKSFVDTLPDGLETKISEGGENLSVGQRQLVCLARAVLRKTKILVLDEATASVDQKTDELIQATIRNEFTGCTILNVAHRLKTVIDSSRIMVLDRGEIAEFDSPTNLLSNEKSLFYGMAKDAGLVPMGSKIDICGNRNSMPRPWVEVDI